MKNKFPVLFVGHGSPMNAIENNEFTETWVNIAKEIPKPKAILVISAHWYTQETRINASKQPNVIYDMYGFPEELYKLKYEVAGSPEYALRTKAIINKDIIVDNSWGIDHGAWSVLYHMFPKANIPVFQLSIDYNASPQEHFDLGKQLKLLREQGVLIIGSGNIVHNLALIDWSNEQGGYPWAMEFDNYIKQNIVEKDYNKIIDYKQAGKSAKYAFYTPEHFYPLLYVLGASDEKDSVFIYNDKCIMGSLSMTSYLFK